MKYVLAAALIITSPTLAAVTEECNHAQSLGQNGGTTSAIDTTGANLLVVVVGSLANSVALSDSEGNTWTTVASSGSGGVIGSRLIYCLNPTTSATHTFTMAATNQYVALNIIGFSGVDSYDSRQSAAYTASSTTAQPGSLTPSTDGALIVSGLAFGAAGTASIDSGFTLDEQVNYIGGTSYGVAVAHVVQSTAAAINPTWTNTTSTNQVATMAVFLAAASSGPAINPISSSIPGSSLDPIRTTIP